MSLFDKLLNKGAKGLWEDVDISLPMARAINDWLNLFYNCPSYLTNSVRLSGLPVIISGFIAILATNELEVNCGNSARAEYIQEKLSVALNKIQSTVQLAAAGGQVVIRPYVEDGQIHFDIVQAGRLFPTRFGADGRIMAGFFTDYKTIRDKDYVRLEHFDCKNHILTIRNEAYRCEGDLLKNRVHLSTVEEWADLSEEVTIENMDKPLFGVIRTPFANTVDDTSPLPVSIYANALDSIQEFDLVYSEFLYELHSGKRKKIVERQAIIPDSRRSLLPGGVPIGLGYKDMTTDTYIVLDPEEQSKPFDDYSPAMRTAGYLDGLKLILRMVENQCHLSPGTFAIDERTGAITATQVISEDRTTYNTCSTLQNDGIKQGLIDVIDACDALCDLYSLAPIGEVETSITFGDSIFEDTAQEFSRRYQMVQGGYLKPEKLLGWYFHVDDETAAAEYLADQSQTVDLFGGM